MYTFIYLTLLVFKLWQKQFSQKLQFCEGGTILNDCNNYSIMYSTFKGASSDIFTK